MSYTSTAIKKLRYLINRDNDQLLVLEKNNGAFDIVALDTPAARDAAVSAAVNNLLAGVPAALDTLNELAAALGDDANFAVTVTTALGNRLAWRGNWAATTDYVRNDIVLFNGGLYAAPNSFTSGGAFVKANWTELAPQIGTFAPNTRVDLQVDATVNGFLPVGADLVNNKVFGIKDTLGNQLWSCSDPTLKSWQPLKLFASTQTILNVFVTAAGTILTVNDDTVGGGKTYRSVDGITFTQVNNSPTMGAIRRSVCQTPNGDIFVAEYTTISGTYTLTLWRSSDDGVTWVAIRTWPNAGNGPTNDIRHLHGTNSDPYITNRVWIWSGDGDTGQSFIAYSDDRGVTWTTIGSTQGNNDQTWRTVDIIFTPTDLIFGMDSPSVTQQVWKWNRTTHVRTPMLADAGNSMYYAGVDPAGRMYFTTTYETGTHQIQAEARILTGRTDGSVAIQPAASSLALPGATRVEWYPYGPSADGSIWFGLRQTVGTRSPFYMVKARLTDAGNPTKQLIVPATRPSIIKPSFGIVGAHPQSFGTSTVTLGANNRCHFVKFRPDTDMIVRSVIVRIGAVNTGNICLGIWDSLESTIGAPLNPLAQSAATPVGAANTNQQVQLDRQVYMARGEEYYVSLQGDTAGTTFLGFDQIFSFSAVKFTDTLTFPFPFAPLGIVPASTTRLIPMILIPT